MLNCVQTLHHLQNAGTLLKTIAVCLVETKLWLLLQDQCYNDTVWDAGGSIVSFSSGCRRACVPDTDRSTDQRTTQCDDAQKYCRGGCFIDFFHTLAFFL